MEVQLSFFFPSDSIDFGPTDQITDERDYLKGLRIAKIKRNGMQPFLVSYEALFRSNLQKKNTGQLEAIQL